MLIELSELKTLMGITDTKSDSRLDLLCRLCSTAILVYTNRKNIEAVTYSSVKFDGDGQDRLYVGKPIISIGTLKIDSTLVASGDYSIYADEGFIYYSGLFTEGTKNIEVTDLRTGYEEIPEDVRLAAYDIIATVYSLRGKEALTSISNDQGNFSIRDSDFSPLAKKLLANYIETVKITESQSKFFEMI